MVRRYMPDTSGQLGFAVRYREPPAAVHACLRHLHNAGTTMGFALGGVSLAALLLQLQRRQHRALPDSIALLRRWLSALHDLHCCQPCKNRFRLAGCGPCSTVVALTGRLQGVSAESSHHPSPQEPPNLRGSGSRAPPFVRLWVAGNRCCCYIL